MIKIKLKTSESLKKKIDSAIENGINKQIDSLIEDTIVDLKDATPKATGYAASRWSYYKVERIKLDISLANTFIIRFKNEAQYIINNDAEYITYLNAGSSKQAPAYFVEQTILKNGFVPTITR